ncbi:zinc finger protein CONSTANS-LIKE 2 [Manihot esculenta]|uniref:Uncharacterized protein n=1 Tax=Manihot esculenta TaxID=3983 RepID=A0ACB7I2S7_MANES|nr:zinc finger protein CONSTANS-LIKE 2 [Manihot esculenta]KAG8659197.1 hypothetical protein MANES_02G021800v8 [Manihot esculenta]
MSSDHYFYDSSFNLSDLFFSDPFPPLYDTDIFQELSNKQNTQYPIRNSNHVDNFSPNMLSSPPSHNQENLSLYQAAPLQPLSDGSSLENGYNNFQMGFEFDSSYSHQLFMAYSHSGVENEAEMKNRSYSSNSSEGNHHFLSQPRFDTLLGSPNYQNQSLSSPEDNLLASQTSMVCSNIHLQNTRTAHTTHRSRSYSSPSATESSFMEEANLKVVPYSAEERKARISKYRAKREQRNFTKTIKYACRKALADSRPRIRGRFARNDESGETPKAACSIRHEDAHELWFDGMHGD